MENTNNQRNITMDWDTDQKMQYPQCLRNFGCFSDDVDFHNEQLLKRSSNLFTEANNVSVDVVQFPSALSVEGIKRSSITNSEDLDQHLSPLNGDIGHRLFILKPSRMNSISECRLHISEAMIRKLLAALEVFPVFLNFLQGFGRRPDTAFGGCKHKIHFSNPHQSSAGWDLLKAPYSYEICYNIKSVFPHRGKPPHNWLIRQTAVYQKYTFDKKQNVWILVQPEESIRKRMEQSFEFHSRHFPENSHWNPLELHLLFISAAAENWGTYFNALEEEFVDRTIEAVEVKVGKQLDNSSMVGGAGDLDFIAEFRRLQILQRFEENVQVVKASLEINEDTIRSVQTLNTTLRDFNSDPTAKITWHYVDATLEQQLADISREKRNIEDLLRKIQGRSRLMYNVLEHQTALHVADLAEMRQKDREKTMAMSEKTVRDTVGVKIMTVVALLYLPSTFVATFLSTGIISFSKDDNSTSLVNFKRLHYSGESLIFFFCVAVPLTALTVGTLYFFERRNRNRDATGADEENVSNSNTPNACTLP